jgi:hypothetical protein
MDLGESPCRYAQCVGIGIMQRRAQTYERNQSPCPSLGPNHDKSAWSLALRSLLSRSPHRTCGHVFHLDDLIRALAEQMNTRARPERRAAQNLTLGYVTEDVSSPSSYAQKLIKACPGVGDAHAIAVLQVARSYQLDATRGCQ